MHSVWIVDDESDFRTLIRMMLTKEGYKVREVEDGKRCLELLNDGVYPDLILLDVMMPELDGWEVCKKIKTTQGISSIPICILTAKNAPIDAHISLNKARANWHLNKPIEREKLLKALDWLLKGKL
jgi:CheY-like chemotaxis protein